MSRENALPDRRAQAETLLAAMNARDFDTVAAMPFHHPDGEFRSMIAAAEGRGVYHGVRGLRYWARDLDAIFDDFQFELIEFREVDDERAVVVTRNRARAKGSGIPLDVRIGMVWTWRNGLLWRNESYADPREAFEAVGLSE